MSAKKADLRPLFNINEFIISIEADKLYNSKKIIMEINEKHTNDKTFYGDVIATKKNSLY
jgi:hypothetical protein